MPRDFGISAEDKIKIAHLIDRGYSRDDLVTEYCVERSTAKEWIHVYEAVGLEGLLNMGSSHKKYSYETKVAAAKDFVDGELTYAEIMLKYGIASLTPLKKWCRAYKNGGSETLKPKPKGRPPGSKNKTKRPKDELERLRAENERLRCELEVQKRLDALALRKSRVARRSR